jgi:carbon-monoxide dehydrogenase large subunit
LLCVGFLYRLLHIDSHEFDLSDEERLGLIDLLRKGGSAVFQGAAALLEKILAAAAKHLDCQSDEIEIIDGAARTRDGHLITLAELAAGGLTVDASFSNDQRLTYAYGTATAHVAVDPGTGGVELIDYLVVEDVGRIVNPLTLHGQVIGATVQGLGGAFMEDLVYDANGQLLAGSLADYLIPTATDFPKIRAISLEHRPSPTNPLGVKGAGEGGIIPVGGLMANAVAGALSSIGAEPNELPLNLTEVLETAGKPRLPRGTRRFGRGRQWCRDFR